MTDWGLVKIMLVEPKWPHDLIGGHHSFLAAHKVASGIYT